MSLDHRLLPGHLVDKVYSRVVAHVESDLDAFDLIDVKRLKESQEMIVRFLLDYIEDIGGYKSCPNDEEVSSKVAKNVIDTLTWRKEFGVNHLKDSDFPIEFCQSKLFGEMTLQDGRLLLVMRVRNLIRLRHGWSNLYIKFVVHVMEKLASKVFSDPQFKDKPKPIFISDSSGIGFGQIDFNFIFTLVPIFLRHYPQGCDTIYLHELPFIGYSMKAIVMRTLPTRISKRIRLSDKKTLITEIGQSNLPTEYLGTSKMTFSEVYSSSESTIQEVGRKNGIAESEIDKMISAMKSIKSSS